MHETYTYVILNPLHGLTTPVQDRLPKTYGVLSNDKRYDYNLSHVTHATGLSPEAIIYDLAHSSPLEPLAHLTPSVVRHLRDLAYASRMHGSTIHLFGMVDSESPFGSRRMYEQLIRHLNTFNVPLKLHVGVWNPIPSDFKLGMHEIASLTNDRISIGSIFPVNAVLPPRSPAAKKYIDGIIKPTRNVTPATISLPLHYPVIYPHDGIDSADIFILSNHSLHGLHEFTQLLRHEINSEVYHLPHPHPQNVAINHDLAKSKHIVLLSNRPSFRYAYAGNEVSHPYYETYHSDSPVELLEMLISPHFGYSAKPYKTVVLLDEVRDSAFDVLLAAYLKMQHAMPYYCCVLQPYSLESSQVVSNMENVTDHIRCEVCNT